MSKIGNYQSQVIEGSPQKEPSNVKAQNARAIKPDSEVISSPTQDGGNFLKSFINATPFFDLFEYVADHLYNGKNLQIKIAKLKVSQPNFYQFCIIADIIVRTTVVIISISLATGAAIKVIK